MRSFPSFNQDRVRFSDEELDKMIPISTEIVYGFVKKTKLDLWAQYGVKYEEYR